MSIIYEQTTNSFSQDLGDFGSAPQTRVGVYAQIDDVANEITKITLPMMRVGSPTGDVTATIWTCSGLTTCDASPTETSSTTLLAQNIATSWTDYDFTFTGDTTMNQYDRITVNFHGGSCLLELFLPQLLVQQKKC